MDIETLLHNAGVNLGALTLSVILRGLLILLIGIICIRLILSLFDRSGARN